MRGPAPDRRPPRGRARSTRNARRHGLSLPVLSDPISSQEVEELACEIAGPRANAEIHELACRIAEAQIDLRRVRHARHAFLASAIGNPDYEPPSKSRTKSRIARELARIRGSARVILQPLLRSLQLKPEGPQKVATILSDVARRLAAMERYERRALSRLWLGTGESIRKPPRGARRPAQRHQRENRVQITGAYARAPSTSDPLDSSRDDFVLIVAWARPSIRA
jgi:hypothetical protein